jgi:acyl-CoA dehydrogenase
MGQRASRVHDVEFKACRVPYLSLLGDIEGQGFKTALMALDDGRIHMAAVAVGVSRRLIDESVGYALSRQQFGRPIAEFQLIQAMIADGEADLRAAQALVEKTALSRDMGENVTLDAASCKYFSTEALWRIADRALQIHGGLGYVSETAVERLFRDSRIFRILDGTSQIMQLVIAREVMKKHTSAIAEGKHAHARKT